MTITELSAILYLHDPLKYKDFDYEGMTDMVGNLYEPTDAYDDVARTILYRLPTAKNVDDLRVIVVKEFLDWYDGHGLLPEATDAIYTRITEEVWLSQ